MSTETANPLQNIEVENDDPAHARTGAGSEDTGWATASGRLQCRLPGRIWPRRCQRGEPMGPCRQAVTHTHFLQWRQAPPRCMHAPASPDGRKGSLALQLCNLRRDHGKECKHCRERAVLLYEHVVAASAGNRVCMVRSGRPSARIKHCQP